MTTPLPYLGDTRSFAETTCGRMVGPTANDLCGKPAVWHIRWDLSVENSIACEAHYGEICLRWVFYDSHPFGATCNLPDSVWVESADEPPGFCRWIVDEETHALNVAEVPKVTMEEYA
jgi:hypothetical protein